MGLDGRGENVSVAPQETGGVQNPVIKILMEHNLSEIHQQLPKDGRQKYLKKAYAPIAAKIAEIDDADFSLESDLETIWKYVDEVRSGADTSKGIRGELLDSDERYALARILACRAVIIGTDIPSRFTLPPDPEFDSREVTFPEYFFLTDSLPPGIEPSSKDAMRVNLDKLMAFTRGFTVRKEGLLGEVLQDSIRENWGNGVSTLNLALPAVSGPSIGSVMY